MSQDRVAALHLLITAQIGGAVTDVGKLAAAVKTLGPGFASTFKQGTDELLIFDRELERLTKKIGRGQGSQADVDKLRNMQNFYANQTQVNHDPGRTPDPTFNMFGGISPEQLAEERRREANRERAQTRSQVAQAAMDLHHRTQPLVQYGPETPTDEQRRKIEQEQDGARYQEWLRTRANGPSQGEIRSVRQEEEEAIRGQEEARKRNAEQQRRHDSGRYNGIGSTDFSRSTRPETYGEWKNRQDPRMTNTAYGRDANGGLDEGMALFQRNLAKLDDRQLEKVRAKFGEINTEARNVSRQMDAIDREQRRRGTQPEYGPGAPGSYGHQEWLRQQADPRSAMSGSARRRFMYATQNIGYGIEDAAVSYQLGGVKAAARAAGNNVSALASLIPNPGIQLASIIGVAALTASAGPLADAFEKAFMRSKIAAEAFGKTLDSIRTTTERIQNVKFDVRDASTPEKLEGMQKKAKDDLETYNLLLEGNQTKRASLEKELQAREDYLDEMQKRQMETEKNSLDADGMAGSVYDKRSDKKAEDIRGKIRALDSKDAGLVSEEAFLRAMEIEKQTKSADPFVKKSGQLMKGFDRNTKAMSEFIERRMKEDGVGVNWGEDRIKVLVADEKQQVKRALASGEIRQEDADRLTKDIDKRAEKAFEENKDKSADFDRRRSKSEKEATERMKETLTEVTDKRKGIILESKKTQKEIDEMTTIPDKDRMELTALNDAALKKKLADFDQPKNFKPITEAIEIGSRADAELKQSLMGRDSSAEKALDIAEKELEVLKSIEAELRQGKIKVGAFKSGKK